MKIHVLRNFAYIVLACCAFVLSLSSLSCIDTDPPLDPPDSIDNICIGDDCPAVIVRALRTTAGDGEVLLDWDMVPEATAYLIYRCEMEIFCHEQVAEVYEAYWLDSLGLTNEYTYYYWVIAHDNGRKVEEMGPQRATPMRLPEPQNLVCENNGALLEFTWTQNWDEMEHTGFRLYGALDTSTGEPPNKLVASAEALDTRLEHTPGLQGDVYYILRTIREAAHGVSWQSEPSNLVGCRPTEPSGLKLLSSQDPNALVVQWMADAWPGVAGENNYTVFWQVTDSDDSPGRIDLTCQLNSPCETQIDGLITDVTYTFWVVARNSAGVSSRPPSTGHSVQGRVTAREVTGILDSTFGNGGVAFASKDNHQSVVNALVLQDDGKPLVVGQEANSGETMLARFSASGQLDNTFANQGLRVFPMGPTENDEWSEAYSVAVQNDGKIVAGGYTEIFRDYFDAEFAVARFLPNGNIDSSFGNSGIVRTAVGGVYDQIFDIKMQSDGKIIAAGVSFNGYDDNAAVVRYNSDGSLDTSFGNGGMFVLPENDATSWANRVAIQADGKIVIAGLYHGYEGQQLLAVRLLADGQLDTAFGSGGTVVALCALSECMANDIVVQPDGKIVVVGMAVTSTGSDIAVLRLLSNGHLDSAFGVQGVALTSLGLGKAIANAVALQDDGRVIVAGTSYQGAGTDAVVARYNADGQLDTNFGTHGVVIQDHENSSHQIYGVAIQPDGRVIIAGSRHQDGERGMVLMRFR